MTFALFLSAAGLAQAPVAAPLRSGVAQVASVDERHGLPTVVWLERPLPGLDSPRSRGLTAEASARAELERHAALYGVTPTEIGHAVLLRVDDAGAGVVVVNFGARVTGLPVLGEALHVVMNRQLEAVALTGFLTPSALHASAAPPFPLGAPAALSRALGEAGGPTATHWADAGPASGAYRRFACVEAPGASARGRPVLYPLAGRLEAAWHLELERPALGASPSAWWALVVSANDGRVLLRHPLTAEAAFGYRVFADPTTLFPYDGPQGDGSTPHPTGNADGTQVPWVAPQWVSVESGPIATKDPWLAPGATETLGNNADAFADLQAPDGYSSGDARASTTTAGAFDRVFDTSKQPGAGSAQIQAAVTHLFYTVNFLHDWYYGAGFTEAAGNAQASNLGRGGLEGDRFVAKAQTYSGRSNAQMTTLADGAPPVLQLYIFDAAAGGNVGVTAPASVAGSYGAGVADFGPSAFDVSGPVLQVDDGTAPTHDGCETPYSNAAAIAGKVAFLDRGTCTFAEKVARAQAAGAIGAIVANNTAGWPPPMPGTDATITIPSLSLSSADAARLEGALPSGLTARLSREAAGPDRDSALDTSVVSHEWGHYLSNRLVGDAVGLVNPTGLALGEGWSDFQSLLLSVREGDGQVASNADWKGVFAHAGYVAAGAGNNGYYFGTRRVPYSTDFAKNALTFKHISDGEPLPMQARTAFGEDGTSNSEAHNAGEVWATMLWEGFAALLRDSPRLSVTEARSRMQRYLVASLEATPTVPTLLEARDALLAVAYAGDPADHRLLADAFARRGAGVRAQGPGRDSVSNLPVVEDFNVGGDLAFVGAELSDDASSCDSDGVLDNGEVGTLTVTVRNVGSTALSATAGTVASPTPGVRFPSGADFQFPPTGPYETANTTVDVMLDGATDITRLDFAFSLTDAALAFPGPVTAAASFRGNADDAPASSANDDVEAQASTWTASDATALPATADFARRALTGVQHGWVCPEPSARADLVLVSPPLHVAALGALSLSFKHRYHLVTQDSPPYWWDGAVVELSADDGATWTDLGASLKPGYDGTVAPNSQNVLKGRSAFGGTNRDYPAMTGETADLGTAYLGQTVRVRFRLATDEGPGRGSWELDDFVFSGLADTPFATVVTDPGGNCGNRRPVAHAGPGQEAAAGATVTFDGSGSFDPDGDALSFAWTQTDGPAVNLSGANGTRPHFEAPRTSGGATLSFSLVVNDGNSDSRPSKLVVQVDPDMEVRGRLGCSAALAGPWAALALALVGWARRRRAFTRPG